MDLKGTSNTIRGYVRAMALQQNFLQFKNRLKVGDTFLLPIDDIGIEDDNRLPELQLFKVAALYKNCVLLEHEHKTWKWTYVHKYCPDYMKLYLMIHKNGVEVTDETKRLYAENA